MYLHLYFDLRLLSVVKYLKLEAWFYSMGDDSGTPLKWLVGMVLFLLAAAFLIIVVTKAGSIGAP
ncbi:MAG: hypothetical protein ACOCUT_02220 [bacterium]